MNDNKLSQHSVAIHCYRLLGGNLKCNKSFYFATGCQGYGYGCYLNKVIFDNGVTTC